MTTAVQHRRGTTAEHSTFTGLEGEVTIDTTKDTAVIHDGSLAGGYPLAKETLANVNPSTLSAITGAATASDDLFLMYDTSALAMKKISRAELNNAITIEALDTVDINGGTIDGTAIGGTTAAAGAFTTLSASGAVTISGGTANGVAYLNGSKVLTSGSALTFNGTSLGVGTSSITNGTAFGGGGQVNVAKIESAGYPCLQINTNTGGGSSVQFTNSGIVNGIIGYNSSGGTNEFTINNSLSGSLTFAVNNSQQMRLTSTGLGIGTSSPVTKLHGYSSGAGLLILESANNGGVYARWKRPNREYYLALDINNNGGNDFSLYDATSAATRWTVDANGNLGIGTSSPNAKLQVTTDIKIESATQSTLRFGISGSGTYAKIEYDDTTGNFNINNPRPYPLRFLTNDTERARIDSSGNLLVGTTSTPGGIISCLVPNAGTGLGVRVTTNGNWGAAWYNASSTYVGYIAVGATSTTYATSSDYRLKNTIAPMTGALAKVAALKPVTYKWNADGSDGEGFIAHELAEVCPQAVTGEKDAVDADGNPVYQGIDTSFLVATLTAAIQEQQAIIEDLKSRLTAAGL